MTAPPPDVCTSNVLNCGGHSTAPNAEIFAVGDGPEAGDFQGWGNDFKKFIEGRTQTAMATVIASGSADDGFARDSTCFNGILKRLQARPEVAGTKTLNTMAVFCHGEAFGVGMGISLHNVTDLATEIAKHADPAKPFRMTYFACMAGGSHPCRGTPTLGTWGDQRGNAGLCEATVAALIAAGLTKVQVDGHSSYGIGSNNWQLRRFYSEGMYPNFIRYVVGSLPGGKALAATDPIPAAPDGVRPARLGTETTVEDPRPSQVKYDRPRAGVTAPANLPAETADKKYQADLPAAPGVYRTSLSVDAPGKGFTAAWMKMYQSGSYWQPAMFSSIQKLWSDVYSNLSGVTPPAGLIPSPLPGSELPDGSW